MSAGVEVSSATGYMCVTVRALDNTCSGTTTSSTVSVLEQAPPDEGVQMT